MSLRRALTADDRSADTFHPTFRMCFSITSYPGKTLGRYSHAFLKKNNKDATPLRGFSPVQAAAAWLRRGHCDSCLSTTELRASACYSLQPIEDLIRDNKRKTLSHRDFLNKSDEPPDCYTPRAAQEYMHLQSENHRHLIVQHGVTHGVTTMLVCCGYQPLEARLQYLSTADNAIVLTLMFVNIHAVHGASMSTSLPSDIEDNHGAPKVLGVKKAAVTNMSRNKCCPQTQTVRDMTTTRKIRGHVLSAQTPH